MTRPLAPPGPLPWRGGPPPEPKPPATRSTEAGEGQFTEAINRLYAAYLAALGSLSSRLLAAAASNRGGSASGHTRPCSRPVLGENGVVHPPLFRPDHCLSDWPDCSLELHFCKGEVLYPLRLLMTKLGNRTLADVLTRLRCDRCGGKPAPVYFCAGHRRHVGGAPPDWAIELVPDQVQGSTFEASGKRAGGSRTGL